MDFYDSGHRDRNSSPDRHAGMDRLFFVGRQRAGYHTEAVDDPRATGFTEPGLSERARARVVGIFAGCQ